MKLFKKRGDWWVDFYAPTGERKRKPTSVKIPATPGVPSAEAAATFAREYEKAEAEAYKKAAEIVAAYMEAGTDAAKITALSVPTLGTLLQARFDSHWSKLAYGTTMKYTVRKLKRDVGHHQVTNITPRMIRAWKDEWATGALGGRAVLKSTINRYLNAISSTLEIAKQDKIITEVPAISFDNEGDLVRERYMRDDEEPRILAWIRKMQEDDIKDRRWGWVYMEHLVVFLTDTGFRFGEAFKFTLVGQEADLEHGVTKNTVGRRIPLTARAYKAAQYLLASEHHKDLEFRSRSKPKVAWDWCTHRMDKCLLALAINLKGMSRRKKLTLHCLRHTCASRLLELTKDIFTVSKWLGHKNIKTTMRYLKLDTKAFAKAAAALEGRQEPRLTQIIVQLRDLIITDATFEELIELQSLVARHTDTMRAIIGGQAGNAPTLHAVDAA